MKNSVAIIGLGWLGQPLYHKLATLGYAVKGSVTTAEKARQLKQHGFQAYPVEISETGIDGDIDGLLQDIDCLLIMVPPGLRRTVRDGQVGSNYVLKMAHLLKAVEKTPVAKVIFISSTSVYSDWQGKVTEHDEPKPETLSGKQLRQAEELFFNSDKLQTAIVRFGGLLGGSRQPAKYLAGRKDLADGNAPVNLIHREDCINILVEIIKQRAFGNVFNAVNPHHPKKSDYYIQKATELGLEPPIFAKPVANEIFKQVDSINLRAVLNFTFKTSI
jgi:nucleoside-diphosphate-sugar epimerase